MPFKYYLWKALGKGAFWFAFIVVLMVFYYYVPTALGLNPPPDHWILEDIND